MTRILDRTGGAKLTGASASLKAVSGRSTRGRANTQAALPNRKSANIDRSRRTLSPPPTHVKRSAANGACQSCKFLQGGACRRFRRFSTRLTCPQFLCLTPRVHSRCTSPVCPHIFVPSPHFRPHIFPTFSTTSCSCKDSRLRNSAYSPPGRRYSSLWSWSPAWPFSTGRWCPECTSA